MVVVVVVMVVAVFVLAQSGPGGAFTCPGLFSCIIKGEVLTCATARVLWLRKGLDDAAAAGVVLQNVYR